MQETCSGIDRLAGYERITHAVFLLHIGHQLHHALRALGRHRLRIEATFRMGNRAQERIVELTAGQSEAMQVHLTARFEFLTVELSPTFEIVAVILRARAAEALIGPGGGSTTSPFVIERAELDETGRLCELFVRANR